jgi:hypothetical protein
MLRTVLVLSLLAGLGACTVSNDGALDLKWHVTDGGAEVACAVVGAATVKVTLTRTATGSQLTAPFSCNSKAGKIEGLRPGQWTVAFDLLNAGGQSLTPTPATFSVRIVAGETVSLPQEVEFAFAATSFVSAAWVITVNGQPATCSDVGGAKVFIDSTPAGGGTPFTDSFPCTAGMGKTDPLPGGTFTFTVSLLDAAGNVLATGATAPLVLTKGETKALGTFELAFDFHDATFTTAYGGACTSFEVRVSDVSAQQCLIYPLMAGPIVASTCQAHACDPQAHEVKIEHLGDRQYLVQVFGYSGQTCYASDATMFTVAGANVALGTIQVPFDAAHLCNAAKPAE